jgi:hypothetical protein
LDKFCRGSLSEDIWLFLLAVQIVLLTIYPVYIAPLFNKYEELEEGTLRTKIEKLASSVRPLGLFSSAPS